MAQTILSQINTFSIPSAETILRTELANGLVVLVFPTPHTQSVVLSGSLDAGALFENPFTHNGLAAMTASALMRGTKTHDFDQLHSELEDIGADLTLGASMHKVGFGGKALAEDLPVLLDLLAEVLRAPSFEAEQVERLRGERLTSLNYLKQDTTYQAAKSFREVLYAENHPYHHSVRGTMERITALTVDDLKAFHEAVYGPHGMVIAIVGNIHPAEAIERVEAAFGTWRNADQPDVPALPAAPQPDAMMTSAVSVPAKRQTDLLIGRVGPSRFAEDYHAATLGNSVLGVFGMMGRMGTTIREREGLAYHAGSRVAGGFGPGAWRISAGVDPQNVERTIELAREELRRFLEHPISAEELADNQSYFIGRLPLQLESNDGIAATLQALETYNLGLDYLAHYREKIMGISAEDVLQAARRYLDADKLVITIAGP